MTFTANPSCIGTCKAAAAFDLSPVTFLSLPFTPAVVDSYLPQNEFKLDGRSFPIPPLWRREMSSSTPTYAHASAAGGSVGYASAPAQQRRKIEASAAKRKGEDGIAITFEDYQKPNRFSETMRSFSSLVKSEDWEGVSSVLRACPYDYEADLVVTVDLYIKEHRAGIVPTHIREEAAALIDGLSPDDLGLESNVIQRIVVEYLRRELCIDEFNKYKDGYVELDLFYWRLKNILSYYERGVPSTILAIYDELDKDPRIYEDKSESCARLLKFALSLGAWQEARRILADAKRYFEKEAEIEVEIALVNYIKERGDKAVPDDLVEVRDALPDYLRFDLVEAFLSLGARQKVRRMLACADQLSYAPKEIIEALESYIGKHGEGAVPPYILEDVLTLRNGTGSNFLRHLIRQGEWDAVRRVMTYANDFYFDPAHYCDARSRTRALATDLLDYIDVHGVDSIPDNVFGPGATLLCTVGALMFENEFFKWAEGIVADYSLLSAPDELWVVLMGKLTHPDLLKGMNINYTSRYTDMMAMYNRLKEHHADFSFKFDISKEGGSIFHESKHKKKDWRTAYFLDRYFEIYAGRFKEAPLSIRFCKAGAVMRKRLRELNFQQKESAEVDNRDDQIHHDDSEISISAVIAGYYESGGDAAFISPQIVKSAIEKGEHTAQDAEMCKILIREDGLGPWRWKVVEELLNRDRTGNVARAVFDHSHSEDVRGAYRGRDSVPPEIIELAQAVIEQGPSNIEQTEDAPESDNGLGKKFLEFVGRFNPWS